MAGPPVSGQAPLWLPLRGGAAWRAALTHFCHGLMGPPRIQAHVSDAWEALACGNRTAPD
jgi:hypothetical protein